MTVGSAFQHAYGDILSLARSKLAHEQSPISTITLAHEVYLGLRDRSDLQFESRVKFLAYASRAMRSLLVDMARERLAQKRSAELLPLTVGEEVADHGSGTPEQMLAMNQAMDRLGQIDERLLRVAEMRAVMGMELADIALALDLSEPTIKRDWKRAKAFLYETLGINP
jgi:RNA polymerase sigma factor (TIGR02999 family)